MPFFTRTDGEGRVLERRYATEAEIADARRSAAEAKLAAEGAVAAMIAAHSRQRSGERERRT